MRRAVLAAGWVLSLSLLPGAAAAKELHWRALEVEARLESDGTLAISELQWMVFSGDWNGGERKFRLEPGQAIELERVVRIDPATGAERELARGDLGVVDRWDWHDGSTLRWRSRRGSDPEFDRTEIGYRLDYRLSGALVDRGENRFVLDHNYAFADRDGVIERVRVRLSLAPEWANLSPLPPSWESGALAPGQNFTRTVELEFRGDGRPERAAPIRLPGFVGWVAVGIFLAVALAFLLRFRERDRALGRFGGEPAAPIDRDWLESQVFSLPPEVVGAAWDRNVGSAEVAALLARLTAEGKLSSEVKSAGNWFLKREDLHLRILVPRDRFTGPERALVDALFGGDETTDTQSIRKRYQGTGFDPAAKIRSGVEANLKRIRGFAEGSPKPAWRPTGLLLLSGLGVLVVAFAIAPAARGLAPIGLVALLFGWLFLGLIPALVGQGRTGGLGGPAAGIFLGLVAHAAVLAVVAWWPASTVLHVGGLLLFACGLARATFNILSTRESAEGLARRRELTRARDWLARELRKENPALEDAWFPYLLAFGLAPSVDRWFRKFGAAARSSSWTSGSGGSFGSSGSSGGGWSGGGGAFGGAGATASWAAAATAMSAGVASPSSSGGGGGGGGGGSSGGGGGGGW